jgi:hypothetical protein
MHELQSACCFTGISLLTWGDMVSMVGLLLIDAFSFNGTDKCYFHKEQTS